MPPRTVLPSIHSSSGSSSSLLSQDSPRPRLPLPPIGHDQRSSSSSCSVSLFPGPQSSGSDSYRSHLMDELDFSTNKNSTNRPKSDSTSTPTQDGNTKQDFSTNKNPTPSSASTSTPTQDGNTKQVSDDDDSMRSSHGSQPDDDSHQDTANGMIATVTKQKTGRRRSSSFEGEIKGLKLHKKKKVSIKSSAGGRKSASVGEDDEGRSSPNHGSAASLVTLELPDPAVTSEARKYVDGIVTRTYVGEVIQGAVQVMVEHVGEERPKPIYAKDSQDSGIHVRPPKPVHTKSLVNRRITICSESESPPPQVTVPSYEPHHSRESYPAHPLVSNLPSCVFNRFHGKKRKLNKLVSHKVLVDFVCPRAPSIPPTSLMTESCLTLRRYYHQLECSKWNEWTHVSGKRRNSETD